MRWSMPSEGFNTPFKSLTLCYRTLNYYFNCKKTTWILSLNGSKKDPQFVALHDSMMVLIVLMHLDVDHQGPTRENVPTFGLKLDEKYNISVSGSRVRNSGWVRFSFNKISGLLPSMFAFPILAGTPAPPWSSQYSFPFWGSKDIATGFPTPMSVPSFVKITIRFFRFPSTRTSSMLEDSWLAMYRFLIYNICSFIGLINSSSHRTYDF